MRDWHARYRISPIFFRAKVRETNTIYGRATRECDSILLGTLAVREKPRRDKFDESVRSTRFPRRAPRCTVNGYRVCAICTSRESSPEEWCRAGAGTYGDAFMPSGAKGQRGSGTHRSEEEARLTAVRRTRGSPENLLLSSVYKALSLPPPPLLPMVSLPRRIYFHSFPPCRHAGSIRRREVRAENRVTMAGRRES